MTPKCNFIDTTTNVTFGEESDCLSEKHVIPNFAYALQMCEQKKVHENFS